MAQIHNSDLSREIVTGIKLQQNVDSIPSQLADKVVPVMEVNPKLLKNSYPLASIVNRTASSNNLVIYSGRAGISVVITGIGYSIHEDATCDNTTTQINATIDGNVKTPLYLSKLSLTAIERNGFLDFGEHPLRIDVGTDIRYSHVFTIANSSVTLILYGYFVENTNA